MTFALATVPHEEQEVAERTGWLLKELKPWHRQLCALLAQGMRLVDIANIMDCTPTYVGMLSRQPLVQQHVKDICAVAGLQLEAQFAMAVDAIGDTLQNGNHKEKIQAARLQMEATGRIGSRHADGNDKPDMGNKLADLAHRLVGLLEVGKMANDNIVEGQVYEIEDANVSGGQVPAERPKQ